MPDASTPSAGGHKSQFGFLAKKIGPVPIWLIAVVLIGGFYWYENYGPGAKSKAAASTDATDPSTGLPYAQELGDAEGQIQGLQTVVDSQSGQTAPPAPPPAAPPVPVQPAPVTAPRPVPVTPGPVSGTPAMPTRKPTQTPPRKPVRPVKKPVAPAPVKKAAPVKHPAVRGKAPAAG